MSEAEPSGPRGRRRVLQRCERCAMLAPLCVCAACAAIPTATRLLLLAHPREWRQRSSTGRIAALCLPSADVTLIQGRAHLEELSDGLDHASRRVLLLHPSPDAPALRPSLDDPRPVCLLVPDGTWKQSARIARRLAARGLERVRVAGAPHRALRDRPSEAHLSTGEAIASALEALDEIEAARSVRRGVRTMVDRSLYTRGKLDAADVLGGLTPEMTRAICAPA